MVCVSTVVDFVPLWPVSQLLLMLLLNPARFSVFVSLTRGSVFHARSQICRFGFDPVAVFPRVGSCVKLLRESE